MIVFTMRDNLALTESSNLWLEILLTHSLNIGTVKV